MKVVDLTDDWKHSVNADVLTETNNTGTDKDDKKDQDESVTMDFSISSNSKTYKKEKH